MNDDAEHAAGRRTAESLRTLAAQAGLSVRELGDLAENRGLLAANRRPGSGSQRWWAR